MRKYFDWRIYDKQTVDDLTTEVFLRAWEAFPSYENRGIPIRAWLYSIAHTRYVDHARRAKKEEPFDEAADILIENPFEEIDEQMVQEKQHAQLREALVTLRPQFRQVLQLRFLQGYPIEQTAEAIGKSPAAIKMLQRRALQELKMIMESSKSKK